MTENKETNTLRENIALRAFYERLRALFEDDPNIEVGTIVMVQGDGEEHCEVQVNISDVEKYDAFCRAFALERSYGGTRVIVRPVNTATVDQVRRYQADIHVLMRGNRSVEDIMYDEDAGGELIQFIIFGQKTVSYAADVSTNPFGARTELIQNVAEDLFVNEDPTRSRSARVNFTTMPKYYPTKTGPETALDKGEKVDASVSNDAPSI